MPSRPRPFLLRIVLDALLTSMVGFAVAVASGAEPGGAGEGTVDTHPEQIREIGRAHV